jgi:alpha-galactosidase
MAYNIKLYNPRSLAFVMKLVAILLLLFLTSALDNGLGKTPQMGWNSWNHYNCNINEAIIRKTADLMVSTGLAAKGYRYINIDDCWQGQRNPITKEIS